MTLSSAIRGYVEVDEGVDESEGERDGDPHDGRAYGDWPDVSPVETVADFLSPLIANGDES